MIGELFLIGNWGEKAVNCGPLAVRDGVLRRQIGGRFLGGSGGVYLENCLWHCRRKMRGGPPE